MRLSAAPRKTARTRAVFFVLGQTFAAHTFARMVHAPSASTLIYNVPDIDRAAGRSAARQL
jgi:hypothetical protein